MKYLIWPALLLALTSCKQPSYDLPLATKSNDFESNIESAIPETSNDDPVIARISGYPEGTSSMHQVKINISDVSDYQYKWGTEESTDCGSLGSYSDFNSASTPIEIDLSQLKSEREIVKVCVIGQKDNKIQETASAASWIYNVNAPGAPNRIELTEGDNEVKGTVAGVEGQTNYLIVRSESPAISFQPEIGREYKANETFGDVTIVATGSATFTDASVKNGETWNYFAFTVSEVKAYSNTPIRQNITLSLPGVQWIAKEDLKAEHRLYDPFNNNNNRGNDNKNRSRAVYICRVDGNQPGRIYIRDKKNPSNGSCEYSLNGIAMENNNNFEVLGSIKGAPDNVELRNADLDDNGRPVANYLSNISEDRLLGGKENGLQMFVCLSYNNEFNRVQYPGKAGRHFDEGCHGTAFENNQIVHKQNRNMRVLVLKN